MRYTEATLLGDLRRLGISSWDWAGANPGQIRGDVRRGMSASIAQGVAPELAEIAEYCWKAYERSLSSTGQVVQLGAALRAGEVPTTGDPAEGDQIPLHLGTHCSGSTTGSAR